MSAPEQTAAPLDDDELGEEYDGPDGEFGLADDAEVDETLVADDDDAWGV